MKRRTVPQLVRAVAAAAAVGTGVPAGAATLHIRPPPGFTARQSTPDGGDEVGYEVASVSDPDTGCQVTFSAKGSGGLNQAALNAEAATPGYAARLKLRLADLFEVTRLDPFGMQGAEGLVATASPKAAPDAIRSLIYVVETPHGRLEVTCVAPVDAFDVWRPVFEDVARGVALPR